MEISLLSLESDCQSIHGCFTLPDDLIRPLLTVANCDSLEKCLTFFLEGSKTDYGRSDLTSKRIVPHILLLSEALCRNPFLISHLLPTLRIIRNLCAGESSNINSFIESNGIEILWTLFKKVQFDIQIVHVGLQALANVVLAGTEYHQYLSDQFFPIGFLEVARVEDKRVCHLVSRLLYTLCSGRDQMLNKIKGDQGVKVLAEMIQTASRVGIEGDYLPWLLSKVCYEGSFFNQLLSELSSTNSSETTNKSHSGHVFTTEQVFLLSLLSMIHEAAVSSDFALSIMQIFKKASVAVDLMSDTLSTYSAAVEILEYSLVILRDICAYMGRDDESRDSTLVVDSLLSAGLLTFLLDLLRGLAPPEIIRRSQPQESNKGKTSCPYKGYRGDIVSVIANCTFRRKHVQDEIRRQNGILLLLEQCVIDEGNPFLREKGLWAMRNLLEGNEENQREVAELKLQGTVDTTEVADLGLQVEVDTETGRPKLVNISSTPSS